LGRTPSERQKQVFYELVADRIQERTTSGKDINGSNFKIYSKEYAKQKGVTRNSVDLVLTGDMLTSFEDAQTQTNVVKIKLKDEEAPKAYNHNVGDTLPTRTFFGIISDSEIDSIIDSVKDLESDSDEDDGSSLSLAALRAAVNTVTLTLEDDGDI